MKKINTSKEDCQYCGEVGSPATPDIEGRIFQWHLDGHERLYGSTPNMKTLSEIVRENVEVEKIREILGLETDMKGNDNAYIIYDEDGIPDGKMDFTEEVEELIDYNISSQIALIEGMIEMVKDRCQLVNNSNDISKPYMNTSYAQKSYGEYSAYIDILEYLREQLVIIKELK